MQYEWEQKRTEIVVKVGYIKLEKGYMGLYNGLCTYQWNLCNKVGYMQFTANNSSFIALGSNPLVQHTTTIILRKIR